MSDTWTIKGREFNSRLLLGTAMYPSREVMLDALKASGTQVATVALRRVKPDTGKDVNLYKVLRDAGYLILPNTAGCFTAEDAVLTAQLAREALETNWVKLEVIADHDTLLPDTEQLLVAAERLTKDGFQVLPYTNDDPIVARKLEQIGCPAVMPLAAPIGSGLGVRNPHNLVLMRDTLSVPLIVDAGVGTASDVAIVFELGCDAVLLNSAIAKAGDPVRMARAIRHAAVGGREAFLARRMPRRLYADASSPTEGLPWQ
ncbi:MAG TPA: thiazole synthase [Acidobacteriota bacterium]|jgi:thiazole synthase|nr:thiazole synthase [Acidobacteriota bacterium]|tara:strand:- start:2255 stop:3031 length:777 start_codon:yes stop_codon:yes gene_type:complete